MFARLAVLTLFALGLANYQALATSKPPELSDIFVYKPDYPCNMDVEDISRFDYASCLLLREEDDSMIMEENESEALTILRDLVDSYGHVEAAYLLAEYSTNDVRFGNSVSPYYVNEVIEAYRKVLSTIALAPNYPYPDNMVAESHHQMELMSHFSMVVLHYYKFRFMYEGKRDVTILDRLDSLDRVVHYGRECQSLPEKQHFNPSAYEAVMKSCRFYVGLAQTLKPLEEKRLSILNSDSCQDPGMCPGYMEVVFQMRGMDEAYSQSIADAWSPLNMFSKDNTLMFGVP